MLLQVAIVEDDPAQAALLKGYLEGMQDVRFQIDCYDSAEGFLAAFARGKYQLLFLDIQLKKLDGLSAARRVRETDTEVCIVFITSLSQFAVQGYEVNARDYIVKPLIYDTFQRKMQRLLPMLHSRPGTLIRLENGDMIDADELIFVEIFGHKLIYHCRDGDLEVYGKLADVEAQLSKHRFLRCNRSVILNPKHIQSVRDGVIRIGGTQIGISAPRKKEFLRELNQWIAR